jgi:hypothetical protein
MDSNLTITLDEVNDDNILEHVDIFSEILNILRVPYEEHTDLLNIIDEMEANLNRFVYLLKLK